ncbi:MAG TPA: cupin domain-containing protein, partial [Polyangiaceae bacterium]|nr:cupin domain-containing protein [Polyangiaceae bacterium]
MHVTRYQNAPSYEAPGHSHVASLRLQGQEVSPTRTCWVGLSHYLPHGGADSSASDAEKIYVVLSGEITVTTDQGEVTLGVLDSCYLAPGERRSIANRSGLPA